MRASTTVELLNLKLEFYWKEKWHAKAPTDNQNNTLYVQIHAWLLNHLFLRHLIAARPQVASLYCNLFGQVVPMINFSDATYVLECGCVLV